MDDFSFSVRMYLDGLAVEMDVDSVASQRFGKNLRRVALFVAEEHRIVLHDVNLRTQPAEGLRQFATERSAAENKQAPRTFVQIENIFIRQVSRGGNSRDRRNFRPGTASDKSALKVQKLALDFNRLGSGKTRLPKKYVNPRGGQPLSRNPAADTRPHTPHPFHHSRKIHADTARHFRAEVIRIAYLCIQARGTKNSLRRDAADIEARTAETIAFYDRYLGTDFGCI